MTTGNTREQLYIWSIHYHGEKSFIAKKWLILATGPVMVEGTEMKADDIEDLRKILEFKFGLYRLGRDPSDASDVVESWI